MAKLPHSQNPQPRADLRAEHLHNIGPLTVAVKVIDIFGKDTMILVPVSERNVMDLLVTSRDALTTLKDGVILCK